MTISSESELESDSENCESPSNTSPAAKKLVTSKVGIKKGEFTSKGVKMNKNKRGEKRLSERSQSTSRMAEGSVEEILKKIEELQGSNNRIEGRLIDLDERVKQFELLKAKVDILSKEIQTLKSREKEMDYREKVREVESKKQWLVIKGMKIHSGADKFESRAQTKEVLTSLFSYLGVQITLVDYYRMASFRSNENTPRGIASGGLSRSPGLVKIKFSSLDDKFLLFSKVAELGKNLELNHVSFQDDLPSFLVKSFKELDKEAFELRKAESVKTRITQRGVGLILQKKSRDPGARWVNLGQGADTGVEA